MYLNVAQTSISSRFCLSWYTLVDDTLPQPRVHLAPRPAHGIHAPCPRKEGDVPRLPPSSSTSTLNTTYQVPGTYYEPRFSHAIGKEKRKDNSGRCVYAIRGASVFQTRISRISSFLHRGCSTRHDYCLATTKQGFKACRGENMENTNATEFMQRRGMPFVLPF